MTTTRKAFSITGAFLFSFVTVFAQPPVADFSSSIVSGCAPLIVKFTDASTGNPTSWSWDFGNGTTSAFQNPGVTYTSPGTYTVQLISTNASGSNTTTKNAYITVHALPTANFSSVDTAGCAPLRSTFTDLTTSSTGSISTWEWSFGDGNVSTEQNPEHSYAGGGNFSVFLKVTNAFGCSDVVSKPQYVKVSAPVRAGFNNATPNVCALPINVNFFSTSSGPAPLTLNWDFGDGTTSSMQNPSHTYSAYGTYNVKLVVTGATGCTSTFQKTIDLPSRSTSYKGPGTICIGSPGIYSVQSNPKAGSVLWNMGDGTFYNTDTVSHAYKTAGNFNIKVITDFGNCRDTLSGTVAVNSQLLADFTTADTATCKAPFTVSFKNESIGGENWKWDFGDGDTSTQKDPSHTYTSEGVFTVTLTATNSTGCNVSVSRTDYINVGKSSLTLTNVPGRGCKPYAFSPEYETGNTVITSFNWDFGDGFTSTDPNPTHVYDNAGIYTLTVITTTQAGCSDTTVVPDGVRIGVPEQVDFTTSTPLVCGKGRVQFTAQVDPSVTSFLWDFGDSTTSTEQNPMHQFTDTGYQTVTLAIEKNGCASSVTKADVVRVLPPVAAFSVKKDCRSANRFEFADKSIGALTRKWDFGDNTSSTLSAPAHDYSVAGDYVVKLITTNGACSDTAFATMPVWTTPSVVSFSKDRFCKEDSITINLLHPNAGAIQVYYWNAGLPEDTSFIGTITPSLYTAVSKPGVHDFVGYTVDSFGCFDTIIKPNAITVFGPTAAFAVDQQRACLNDTATFIDSSTVDPSNPIVNWSWDFGDGTTQSYASPPFTHTYKAGGTYSVKLAITDQLGCTDTLAKFDYVARTEGAADFATPDTLGCLNSPIFFNNVSIGVVTSTFWSFGDGSTSNDQYPVHRYTDSGAYSVKLRIEGLNGCIDSIEKANFVSIKSPKAFFGLSNQVISCPPVAVTFIDSSYYAGNYEWDFGDGNLSSIPQPVNVFISPGQYISRLKITSSGGCVDSFKRVVNVVEPYGELNYNITSGCSPLKVSFTTNTFGATDFAWDFGNGVTTNNTDSVLSYTYPKSGAYIPSVLIKDPSGCSITVYGKDTIRVDDFTAGFTADRVVFCDSGTVKFADSTGGLQPGVSYLWNFGDGQQSTESNPSHFYSRPGKYTVSLVQTSVGGCSKTTTYAGMISVSASPIVSIGVATEQCEINKIKFTSNVKDSAAIRTWQWTFGNGERSANPTPPVQTFLVPGTYSNSLTVINQEGCQRSALRTIEIKTKQEVIAVTDTLICRGRSFKIDAAGLSSYSWQPTAGLSCSSCNAPSASPLVDTWFKVQGRQVQTGCTVQDSIFIRVVQPYTLTTSGNRVVCQPQTIQLQASGAPNYLWSPVDGLSNATVANPTVNITASATYQVLGFDSLNCFDDSANVSIKLSGFPSVDLGPDVVISVGNAYTFKPVISADVVSYLWVPATGLNCSTCPNPELRVLGNTTYALQVRNADGCIDVDTVQIMVTCDRSTVFIPNTFSPNGDGANDYFYPRGKGIFSISYLAIFNRWGQKVFERKNVNLNDQSSGWDGKVNGQSAVMGAYTYVMEMVCDNNQILKYSGNINLIQ